MNGAIRSGPATKDALVRRTDEETEPCVELPKRLAERSSWSNWGCVWHPCHLITLGKHDDCVITGPYQAQLFA